MFQDDSDFQIGCFSSGTLLGNAMNIIHAVHSKLCLLVRISCLWHTARRVPVTCTFTCYFFIGPGCPLCGVFLVKSHEHTCTCILCTCIYMYMYLIILCMLSVMESRTTLVIDNYNA